ncbi:hypothetical protein [Streptomonospora sp. PA3]|uniref:hypothetical protein n=1 Tax=Streptomonospora sp. PA3 TaxID=2607326 RepID=UPI0012DC61F7|nr:hypothetical protein [Streptomonospora sp. PA3]
MVIDELPYLIEQVAAFEGILQKAWHRELSRKPRKPRAGCRSRPSHARSNCCAKRA